MTCLEAKYRAVLVSDGGAAHQHLEHRPSTRTLVTRGSDTTLYPSPQGHKPSASESTSIHLFHEWIWVSRCRRNRERFVGEDLTSSPRIPHPTTPSLLVTIGEDATVVADLNMALLHGRVYADRGLVVDKV